MLRDEVGRRGDSRARGEGRATGVAVRRDAHGAGSVASPGTFSGAGAAMRFLGLAWVALLCGSCGGEEEQPPTRVEPGHSAARAYATDHRRRRAAAAAPSTRAVASLPVASAARPVAGVAGAPADPRAWPFVDPRPEDPAAARKRPLEIRDLYRLRGIRSPRVSPDGRRVVFVRTAYDLDEGKANTDLFVVGVDGKGLRRLTRSKSGDFAPRWAPDGQWIYFVSTRTDGAQLWRLPMRGGDPEQLTHLGTGVANPVVSPDGTRVAFTSAVYPEHPLDDAKNRARMKKRSKGPVHAHLADELFFRHWTSYDEGRRNHILLLDVKTRKLADLTPGRFHSPPISLTHGVEYDFAPDGKELCFASDRTTGSARASSTNSDVYVVAVPPPGLSAIYGGLGGRSGPLTTRAAGSLPGGATGSPGAPAGRSEALPLFTRNVTGVNPAWDGACRYSPDGKSLAFLMQRQAGYESDRFRLALLDRATGRLRVLTESFDTWVAHYQFFPDGRRILFGAPVRGRWPLFTVRTSRAGGAPRRLPAPPSARQFHLGPKGRVVVLTYSSVAHPTEVYAVASDGSAPRQLTELNRAVTDEVDLRPAESLWLPGDGGRKIQVFVVKPHGFRPGKRYPLLLNVHGGPQYQWSDSFRGDWQVYPAKGYVVAFPNTTGSLGFGQAFTRAISGDWGGRVFRDTMAVTDGLAKLGYVDASRMGIMGWSYGGYLVNYVIGKTRRFKAAASMMGVYDLRTWYSVTEEQWFPERDLGGQPWAPKGWERFSPSRNASRIRTPTLILTGERDYRIPYTQSIALFTDLRKQGVDARLVIFSRDGHWPSRVRSMPVYYNAHLEWFARYLGGGPAPWRTKDLVDNHGYKSPKRR